MRITIRYEASWQNSFLDGSNNEPLPKNGRNFIGSMTTMKGEGNFIRHRISKDTVMGILNRLIGDQRKLYQARQSSNYYFKAIEKELTEADIIDREKSSNAEIVYIRNMSGNEDQNAFTGMIKSTDPAFSSVFSSQLWGVLQLDLNSVLKFINDRDYMVDNSDGFDPLTVINQLELINSFKAVDVSGGVETALNFLKLKYSDVEYKLTAKGQVTPITFYCSALYLQIERLKQQGHDLSEILTAKNGLSGISKRGFTKKDFMVRYTTGKKKLIWGNPYLLKEKRKGEGEVISMLTKASGTLEINLKIPEEKALELQSMIEAAGVSSFYLGKKGLAYVDSLRV
jgi:hypothetical protein